jgi:two-component system cell cycle sensor histidine kinase/response regulator CckA
MSAQPLDREVIVLLAADEPEIRDILEKLLKKGGYELIIATDGQDGLQQADEHKGRIDLLVSKLQMTGMTGPDLARALKHTRPEIRVMFLSPYPQGLLVLDDGWLFMQKPFLPKVLLERIEELMKKPAMPTTDRSHA